MRVSPITLIILSIISVLLYKYNNPYERGFECDDKTIFKPYYPIMIPMFHLLFFASSIPTLSIYFIESKLNKINNKKLLYSKLSHFYFGLILSFILVLICKNFFGRLRPNSIIGLCNASHYCSQNSSATIPQFICENQVPKLVKESRRSFYSGHSSVGTYSAFYLIIFIYHRMKSDLNLKIMVQSIILFIGLIPGFTQGIGYWHHLSDIITGYSVGAFTALLVAKYVAKL